MHTDRFDQAAGFGWQSPITMIPSANWQRIHDCFALPRLASRGIKCRQLQSSCMVWDPTTKHICKHFIVGHIMIALDLLMSNYWLCSWLHHELYCIGHLYATVALQCVNLPWLWYTLLLQFPAQNPIKAYSVWTLISCSEWLKHDRVRESNLNSHVYSELLHLMTETLNREVKMTQCSAHSTCNSWVAAVSSSLTWSGVLSHLSSSMCSMCCASASINKAQHCWDCMIHPPWQEQGNNLNTSCPAWWLSGTVFLAYNASKMQGSQNRFSRKLWHC